MSLHRTLKSIWIAILLVAVSLLAFAACGGGEGEAPSDRTPVVSPTETKPAEKTPAVSPAGTKPAEGTPTQAPKESPTGPGPSGGATATAKAGTNTFNFEGGGCEVGPGDAWLKVSIGQIGGGSYFELVVGAAPGAAQGTRSAKGGGEFSGNESSVTWQYGTTRFTLTGGKLTLQSDLKSGEFSGSSLGGTSLSGSFKC